MRRRCLSNLLSPWTASALSLLGSTTGAVKVAFSEDEKGEAIVGSAAISVDGPQEDVLTGATYKSAVATTDSLLCRVSVQHMFIQGKGPALINRCYKNVFAGAKPLTCVVKSDRRRQTKKTFELVADGTTYITIESASTGCQEGSKYYATRLFYAEDNIICDCEAPYVASGFEEAGGIRLCGPAPNDASPIFKENTE
eukprot:Opistho-2@89223